MQELAAKEGTVDTNTTVNQLGLLWNTSMDAIGYATKQFHLEDLPVTKRRVLQLSSKIYDPLGFLSPVTVQARVFMQELWRASVSWDEPLDQQHIDTWQRVAEHLQDTTDILLLRYYPTPMSDAHKKLHVFCDTSKLMEQLYTFVRILCHGQDQSSPNEEPHSPWTRVNGSRYWFLPLQGCAEVSSSSQL